MCIYPPQQSAYKQIFAYLLYHFNSIVSIGIASIVGKTKHFINPVVSDYSEVHFRFHRGLSALLSG